MSTPQEWFPMDSAPEDMTDILIFDISQGGQCVIGHKRKNGYYYSPELDRIETPVLWQPIYAPDDPAYKGKYCHD